MIERGKWSAEKKVFRKKYAFLKYGCYKKSQPLMTWNLSENWPVTHFRHRHDDRGVLRRLRWPSWRCAVECEPARRRRNPRNLQNRRPANRSLNRWSHSMLRCDTSSRPAEEETPERLSFWRIYVSINQSINRTINQSINGSINRSINRIINQSINE